MKRIYKNLLFFALAVFTIYSCDDMMDVHKEYIEGGEIIYAPKVDSMIFLPGKDRVYFQFWLKNAPNAKSVDVFWNSKQDSLIIPVTPSAGVDSVELYITGLEEKSHTFDVRVSDTYGHKSLYSTGYASSYGEIFQSILNPRYVRTVIYNALGGSIYWYSVPENLLATEVRYTDINGNIKTIQTPASSSTTTCSDAMPGTPFEHRSLFVPEENAVDIFYLDWISGSSFPDYTPPA